MVFVGEFAASLKQQRVGIRAPEAPPLLPPQAPPPGPASPVSAPPLPPIAQVSSTESTICQSTLLAKGLDCIRTPKHHLQDAIISNTAMFVPAGNSSKSYTPRFQQSTQKVFI